MRRFNAKEILKDNTHEHKVPGGGGDVLANILYRGACQTFMYRPISILPGQKFSTHLYTKCRKLATYLYTKC